MRIYSLTKVICDCMSTTLCVADAENGVPSVDEACQNIDRIIDQFCKESDTGEITKDRIKENVKAHLRDIIAASNFNKNN